MQNDHHAHQKKKNSKNSKKTTATITVMTCLSMCVMGYEISKTSTRKGLEASDHFQKPLVYLPHTSTELEEQQAHLKFLTAQTQIQAQKILELKQEIQNLNYELHELRLTPFPKKEIISKTFELKKDLTHKENELSEIKNDYRKTHALLIDLEKKQAKLFDKSKKQNVHIRNLKLENENYQSEIAYLYDHLKSNLDRNQKLDQETLKLFNQWESEVALNCCLKEKIAELEHSKNELVVQSKLNHSLNQSVQKHRLKLALTHFQNQLLKELSRKQKDYIQEKHAESLAELEKKNEHEMTLLDSLSLALGQLSAQSQELEVLLSENSSKNEKIQQLQNLLVSKDEGLTQLENEYQKIFDDLASHQENLSEMERLVQIEKTQLKELNHLNRNLNQKIEELQNTLQQKELENQEYAAYSDDLNNSFLKRNSEQTNLLLTYLEQIQSLENLLEDKSHELNEIRQNLSVKEKAFADLEKLSQENDHQHLEHEKKSLIQEDLIITLNQQKQAYEEKIFLLGDLLKHSKEASNFLEDQLDQTRKSFLAINDELQKLKIDWEESQNHIAQLEAHIYQQDIQLAFLKDSNDKDLQFHQSQHEKLTQELSLKNDKLSELAELIKDQHQIHLEHQTRHQSTQEELSDVLARISLLESSVREKEEALLTYKQNLENTHQTWNEKHDHLLQEIQEKEKLMHQLEMELVSLQNDSKSENQNFLGQIQNAEAKISSLEMQLSAKEKTTQEYEAHIEQLQNTIQETEKKYSQHQVDFALLNQTKEQLFLEKQMLESNKHELDSLSAQLLQEINLKENLLNEFKASFEHTQTQLHEQKEKIDTLESALSNKTKEVEQLQQTAESKEFNLIARQQKLEEDLFKYKVKLSSLEYQLAEQERSNSTLAQNHSQEYIKNQLHRTIDLLKQQIEEQKSQNQTLNNEILASRQQVEAEKARFIEIQQELSRQLQEFRKERGEHESLMKQLVSELEEQKKHLHQSELIRHELAEEFEKWKGVSTISEN